MRLLGKPVGAVAEADLDALIAAGVAEGYSIEFKMKLPLPRWRSRG